jgi:hypothetical protein
MFPWRPCLLLSPDVPVVCYSPSCYQCFGAPAGAGDHAVADGPAFNVVPAVIASLLLLANAQLLMLLLAISLVVPALAVAGP